MLSLNKDSKTAEKERCVLALDAGGTFIKSAIVAAGGSMVEKTFRKTPVDSQEPAEVIIGNFILGEVLGSILLNFKAECLVLGGQISKSFTLFANPLKKQIQLIPSLKKITCAQLIDSAALYGAAKLVF